MHRSKKHVYLAVALALSAFAGLMQGAPTPDAPSFDPSRGLVLRGTIVTMDDQHTVTEHGSVLVRNDRIIATWQGEQPPVGTPIGDAVVVDLGTSALIYPGMINLHSHPTYNMLRLWPAPSSHVQAAAGRPLGTEPYANRYQWNTVPGTSPPEYRRLVDSPQVLLISSQGLNLDAEMVKYSMLEALVGGETSLQGASPLPATDAILARNAESVNFGRQRIESRVPSIDSFTAVSIAGLRARMQNGQVDAWLVHLAEGVRDADRRPGDPFSSRSEFGSLKSKGLLTDMTVIVQGTALELQDFADMRAAPSIRSDGTSDGLGAKLVWSPLSNLLLYGSTTNVYEALAAGVLVSLGTDWSPSGSRNLLGELKVADIALHNPALLGRGRDLISNLSVKDDQGQYTQAAEIALDRLLVDMVTRNPARTLRWQDEVASIEPGKIADLFVITGSPHLPRTGLPSSPYRSLIDASERNVRLVLVGGDPLVGDVDLMEQLKPGDYEVVSSGCECFQKAVDVTRAGVPKGDQTLATLRQILGDALMALGGDHPPAGGGPADDSNTYSYLKERFTLPFAMTDEQFRELVLVPMVGTVGGRLNLERLTLTPVLADEDGLFFDMLGERIAPATGLLEDPQPPFLLYPSNTNQAHAGINPFTPKAFEYRWYPLPGARPKERGTRGVNVCAAITSMCERR